MVRPTPQLLPIACHDVRQANPPATTPRLAPPTSDPTLAPPPVRVVVLPITTWSAACGAAAEHAGIETELRKRLAACPRAESGPSVASTNSPAIPAARPRHAHRAAVATAAEGGEDDVRARGRRAIDVVAHRLPPSRPAKPRDQTVEGHRAPGRGGRRRERRGMAAPLQARQAARVSANTEVGAAGGASTGELDSQCEFRRAWRWGRQAARAPAMRRAWDVVGRCGRKPEGKVSKRG